MKCDNCKRLQNNIAIAVGDNKICQKCVDNAASERNNGVIINEVLAYMDTYRHSSNKRRMREACTVFFNENEIFDAKIMLHNTNPTLFGECIKRQDSTAGGRTKEEANIEDIYDWFRKLDDNDHSVTICAKNLKRVPRYNPEETDNTSMIERIIKLEEVMKAEKDTHLALISRTCKLEEKIFNGTESLENKITQVNENLTKMETGVVKMSDEVINIDKEVKSQKTHSLKL